MEGLEKLEDGVLIHRSLEGDAWAFATLVRRYEGPLVTLIRYRIPDPDDAEDVLQNTLLFAWLRLSQLKRRESVKIWLLRIAQNCCRDFYRSPQRRNLPIEGESLTRLTEDQMVEARMANRFGRQVGSHEDRETAIEVAEAIDRLPQSEKDSIKLFYFEGLSISEIAGRLRRPAGTIKSRLYSARHHLRRFLELTEGRGSSEDE